VRYFDWLVAGIAVAVCALVVVLAWPLDVWMWIALGLVLVAGLLRGYAGGWGRRELEEHPPDEDVDEPWWKARALFWFDRKRRF
jgi:hypothetical protein